LLLVSVPGLLVLVDAARSPAVAARRGWWFGFGHHLLGLYWVTEAILFEAARFWWFVPLAVPALAATLALFIGAACLMARLARPGWPRAVALAGAWVLADLARQFVLTGFPWNPWGSVWAIPGPVGDVFIQPAAWVGVGGLTFATLLLAATPVLGWRWRTAGVVVLVAWVAFGVLRLGQSVPPLPLRIALIQGNVAQGQKWNQDLAVQIFERYLRLTEQAQAAHPAAVVWPETAFPGLLDADEPARLLIEQATAACRHWSAACASTRASARATVCSRCFQEARSAACTINGIWCRSVSRCRTGCRCRSWSYPATALLPVPGRAPCTFRGCRRSGR
jgi:apolipoprotein N-acyltransferase